ncbi:MAG: hypothetical protein ACK4GT_10960 [Pararhodobacter sp.]
MAEDPAPPARDPAEPRPSRIAGELVAFGLSLAWLVLLIAAFSLMQRQGMRIADTLGLVVVGLAVFLPVVLIWVCALLLRAARDLRAESQRLQASVESLRRGWVRDQQAAALAPKAAERPAPPPALPPAPLPEISDDQLTLFTTRRTPPSTEGAQPVLALENPLPNTEPLPAADFIRALSFPENESDEAGFAALRRALEDHGTAILVRAAQDVLSALAQEGIYMDNLHPDRARPEIWRAFALGARGAQVAGLGGVRDRSCLALTYARMRSDPGFREAAHRFLRAFDRRFAVFEASATDSDIAQFAETRTARAFMLLGRVTGIFG